MLVPAIPNPRRDTLPKSKTARNSTSKAQADKYRGWPGSVLFAAIAVMVVMAIAVGANLAIGHIIHWNIVSVFAVIGFVFLVIGRKYKTI